MTTSIVYDQSKGSISLVIIRFPDMLDVFYSEQIE